MGKAHSPGFLKVTADARSRVTECTVADVKARQTAGEAFTLIDVREDREYAAGHVPGAVHIGRGVLERDIERAVPDPATPIVLYCGGGFRSALAADSLQKMGYTNVISMDGGWTGWVNGGGEVER
jgi:rhodanese-related sulfurtransferase